MVLCFNAVCLLWVFFRAPTFADAMTVIHPIFLGRWEVDMPVWSAAVVALAGGLHLLERLLRPRFDQIRERFDSVPGAAFEGLAFGAILALVVATSGAGAEFIYFQF